ncbi:hypothetical protein KIN20_037227 [Parelaphostrongylus tenuis]|uniref:Uncharacterized protein n=1 Tax=Parelaphostrongylus tenuis TaxID=148309 RepID=A0AAD5REF6_PARTN|nr:hypothetical protein KIN20_037227 [Parelaphostrongylus tenuis]
MKRAKDNADTTVVPRKCIKLNLEELKSADTATLIEKILSTTDQLNEANETDENVESTCRRCVVDKSRRRIKSSKTSSKNAMTLTTVV